ncbi:hypothetical protein KM1_095830 [Entamoeba histolytica HM-3:IMSS]|uniref:Uncharacterized protein n=5 Tax=Entamoeba histolytica TaxID=5759 RepID=C4MA84_ENTH1|nr:hypothetical protein EHI_067260 [Entamoeba histolytica HM-1:IMSS]EMD48236.1 Hypothetical protein EHI5A_078770 [Entamoeba histolytica KU27]EMS11085.1 hypothetical protein KM1_095830 [Entamoeba histolytica HM-3:IMSS]ENY62850.1 hypothetical protein EHI7A_048780 [Entamoeba histolytica HM-1:IMSS-A]BAN38616.1 hypothetical protein [Entamoeba histolytica]EAL47270.1 hypothetical protein EHI_067260 [Entamoeba histolytica HM-1:IMSS]|eukprot:XP_652656.1 hypothetical protein EHI_067260 [Entamoeba histolytica HM-1:IMSS]
MSISFKIHYVTVPDQVLFVVFDDGKEVPLTWTEGHYWVGNYNYEAPKHYTWHYVVRSYDSGKNLREEEIIGTREHDFVSKAQVHDWWFYPWLTEIVEDPSEKELKETEERLKREAEEAERKRKEEEERLAAEEAERKRKEEEERLRKEEEERLKKEEEERLKKEEEERLRKEEEERLRKEEEERLAAEEAERKRKELEAAKTPSPTPEEEKKKEKELKIRLCGSETNWDLFKMWTGKACCHVLYDSTVDEFTAEAFNECVGGNNSVIVFIHSQGYIFGSYTSVKIPEAGENGAEVKKDSKSFAFSFSNPYGHGAIRYICDEPDTTLKLFPNNDTENVVEVHNFFTVKQEKDKCYISKNFEKSYNETSGRGALMFVRAVEPDTFPIDELIAVKLTFNKNR